MRGILQNTRQNCQKKKKKTRSTGKKFVDVREKENNESGERTDTRFRVMGREEEAVGKDGDVDILYLGGMKGFQERELFACHSVRHINDLFALVYVSPPL